MAKQTQTERVLERLQKAPLTQMEAITELGIMRLAPRIHELRQAGHAIDVETVEVPTRVPGETAHVARYALKDCAHGHDYRDTEGSTWGERKCHRCGLVTGPEFRLSQEHAA